MICANAFTVYGRKPARNGFREVSVYICQFGNYLRIWPGCRKLNANDRALFASGSSLQAIGAARWNHLFYRAATMGVFFVGVFLVRGATMMNIPSAASPRRLKSRSRVISGAR